MNSTCIFFFLLFKLGLPENVKLDTWFPCVAHIVFLPDSDAPAPAELSDDGSCRGHLHCNFCETQSQNLPAKPLLNS